MKINITKRFLLSLCLMTLTLLCGENKAWGQAATLPVTFNDGISNLPTGFTQNGLGKDYSASPKLKFDNTGDYLIVQFDSDPSNFSCSVKQNGDGLSSNKFDIQYSTDGNTYTTFRSISNIGDGKSQTVSFDFSTLKGVRYIKWIYTKKGSGNYGLGKISIEKATTTPTLEASSTSLSFPQTEANTSSSQAFTLNGTNLTGNATLSLSGTYANLFNVTPTTVTPTDGAITDETVTVTYAPTETGTHTATLTISSDGAKSQTITLNGTAPQFHTVSWKVNDANYTKGAPTTKVADGSSVTTLPTVPSDIAGKTFVGWTDAEIATPSATAPPTLFTKAANAPAVTGNVTYYAVFASASGTGESSEELTEKEIVNLGKLSYGTEKTYSGTNLKYSINGNKDQAGRAWIQLKNTTGTYIKITAPDNITKMNLKISSATNLKDGIDDISKHTAFDAAETVGLVTEDCTFTNSSENIGSILGSKIDDNLVTIETTSASKVVYLKVSKGARIWGITTYFSDLTYSNYATTVPLSFSFSDTDDLTEYLPASNLADQTITLDRKVYSGWNTFCVPFALTQAQLEEAYGSGAVAKYLSGVTTDGAAATLHFTPENGGGIEANKAYLLYLTADVTEAKTFSGVTLEPAGTCTTTVNTDNGDYTFQGILAPTALETNDRQYFLNSAGTYFVLPLNNTSKMKATRAYIIVPTPTGSAQGRQYNFDFNGTTTAIDKVTVSGMEDGAWYTISGIRVNRPAAKGVYIHNGRKVIVK